MPVILPHVTAGKLRALGVATKDRSSIAPEVPPIADTVPGYDLKPWWGISGPAGLPKEVVEKINTGVKKALEEPAVRKRIEETGSLIVANTPEQFAAQIKAEYEVYKKVVDTQKLKLD